MGFKKVSLYEDNTFYKWNGYDIIAYKVKEVDQETCTIWVENEEYGVSAYRFSDIGISIYSSLNNLKNSVYGELGRKSLDESAEGDVSLVCEEDILHLIDMESEEVKNRIKSRMFELGFRCNISYDMYSALLSPDRDYYYLDEDMLRVIDVRLSEISINITGNIEQKDLVSGNVVMVTFKDAEGQSYKVPFALALGSVIFMDRVIAEEALRFVSSIRNVIPNG